MSIAFLVFSYLIRQLASFKFTFMDLQKKIIIKRSENDKKIYILKLNVQKKWYKSANTIGKKAYKILNCNKSFIRKLQGGKR